MSNHDYFGIPILSDLPQSVLDLAVPDLHKILETACGCLSRYGVATQRIDIFRLSGTSVFIEAAPHKEALAMVPNVRFVHHICPACSAVYQFPDQHPNNGCNLGVIETILEC